jgi:nucleotide-binding universal stress UspA family protein
VERGDVAAQILGVAHDVDCGLVVMATRGRAWLERLLRGSVTERVTQQAGCPVVLVQLPRGQNPPQRPGGHSPAGPGPVPI